MGELSKISTHYGIITDGAMVRQIEQAFHSHQCEVTENGEIHLFGFNDTKAVNKLLWQSGFAKNIFTVHARKFDYISSKIISMMAASAVLMLVSLVQSLVFCTISGVAIGSIGGVIIFWLEKWLLTAPFAAAIWVTFYSVLSVTVLKRKDV